MTIKTINLCHPEESEIKYKIHNFPDGHNHIELLGSFNKADKIHVITRIKNSDDLFIVKQICQILKDTCAAKICLDIVYLYTARMDRKMSLGEAFDLKIVVEDLVRLDVSGITILSIHNEFAFYNLLNQIGSKGGIFVDQGFSYLSEILKKEDYIICYPDEGSYKRCYDGRKECIICSKKRDKDNNILYFKIEKAPKSIKNKRIIVIDDLCDGGGTFVGISSLLSEKYPNIKKDIFVTHAIQKSGIDKLSSSYDQVYITNSYADWEEKGNVHVIDVLKK